MSKSIEFLDILHISINISKSNTIINSHDFVYLLIREHDLFIFPRD